MSHYLKISDSSESPIISSVKPPAAVVAGCYAWDDREVPVPARADSAQLGMQG